MTALLTKKNCTVALGVTTFLFVAQQVPWLSFLRFTDSNTIFYLLFLLFGITGSVILIQTHRQTPLLLLRAFLALFWPVALLFAIGIASSDHFHFLVYLCTGLYVIAGFAHFATITLSKLSLPDTKENHTPASTRWRAVFVKHGRRRLLAVLLATLFFFSFGLSHLSQFVAVDEPLWLDGRITRFWKNLKERDLEKTDVSDKPGITIALASGPGLLFVTPKDYRDTRSLYSAKNPDIDIHDYYLAFRLPLLITITIFLPFFYFLLTSIIGASGALYSYLCIALSPVLIGMSKIVNPDSLLWIFAPLSFLAYLAYLHKRTWRTLILSGIFLGLALLTKYVANFLIVYFFGYIFLRYLFAPQNEASFGEYFKKEIAVFAIWLGTGLTTLYLLLPALWLDPASLLTSTLFSQAFEKVAPLFIGLVLLILLDQYLFQARFTSWLMDQLRSFATAIERLLLGLFLCILLLVIGNGALSMPWIDFMHVLASPKSSYQVISHFDIFLSNFYPLFFGIPLVVLVGIFGALLMALRNDNTSLVRATRIIILSLIVFILLYALASTVNQVALINRYQIILYPLISILGGIGLDMFTRQLSKLSPHISALNNRYMLGPLTVGVCLIFVLWHTPFPLSFSSSLLPTAYTTDIKDMGSGSYEAAQHLNTLPNAEDLVIWTDKRGVCKIFVGMCLDGFDFNTFPKQPIDYVVISTGRESRTERFMANPYLLDDAGLVRFDSYYEKTDPLWEILINDRSGQFVRIFRFDPASAQ